MARRQTETRNNLSLSDEERVGRVGGGGCGWEGDGAASPLLQRSQGRSRRAARSQRRGSGSDPNGCQVAGPETYHPKIVKEESRYLTKEVFDKCLIGLA